jgi:NAD(P) transhydrogenase subunit beta
VSIHSLQTLCYIISSIAFISGLKMMTSPASARYGNMASAGGMILATVVTVFSPDIVNYQLLASAVIIGAIFGVISARWVPMTAMPQMVAMLNAFGGGASALVAWNEYLITFDAPVNYIDLVATFLAASIGALTFTGSLIAYAKLSERMTGRPLVFKGYLLLNAILLLSIIVLGIIFSAHGFADHSYQIFLAMVALSLILGILSTTPIGGADMPVIISFHNSWAGIAACATGFVLLNQIVIVAGALVGVSGFFLARTMCKSMNRSFTSVILGGFGAVSARSSDNKNKQVESINVNDAYLILEAAQRVLVVPGYGLAVAQAQHALRELEDLLEKNGAEVTFAIHPVAGRMPGHMNVLLAEANVSYDLLVGPETVNAIMETYDVCMVIGANDVVNTSAREEPGSPIYGMPIIDVDRAKTVIVMKRSLASGFAGIDNPLFYKPNVRLLFGDAKAVLTGLVDEFKES